MNTNGNGTPDAVANLRASRKEQATLQKAKAPAKQAPAKAPAKRTAKKPAASKLTWKLLDERGPGKSAVPMVGTCGAHSWSVSGEAKSWTVTHIAPDGTETVLTEKPVGYGAAYKLVRGSAEALAKGTGK